MIKKLLFLQKMHRLRLKNYGLALFLLFAAFVPLFYSLYTEHIWEDYYITYKFSRNLADGYGLVYFPGEKAVHGFTSPLGVLLPALTYLICRSDSMALWLFRIFFGIPCFIAAIYMLYKTSEKVFKDYPHLKFLCPLFLVFEVKSVMFSVNGMETALMLFFVSWLIKIFIYKDWDWRKIGFCSAALMWTRPDSCIYIGGIIISFLIFFPELRKSQSITFIKSIILGIILYMPWFLFAWFYFGSPIPHTIIAKNAAFGGIFFSNLTIRDLYAIFSTFIRIPVMIYYPVYPQFGSWPFIIYVFSAFLGYFAIFATIAPLKQDFKPEVKALSLFFIILCAYFAFIRVPYPWYFPPAGIPSYLVISAIFIELTRRWALRHHFLYAFFLISISGFLLIFFLDTERMKAQQEIVENGNRMKIGLWLNKNSNPGDRIFLECLGYIGYFSGRKVLDYPGLVSPEVVKIIQNKKNGYVISVEELAPEWVVAREFEARNLIKSDFFRRNYYPVAEFNVRDKISELNYLFGLNYLYYDSFFIVYKKLQREKGENNE
ncbi:MAG TPA: hypothetical protein PLN24_05215 [Victivallales bacterium]|nr:hypothetical protein [Victivallales bacterium]